MRPNYVILFLSLVVSLFAKPMEALSEYNVFLIHGAGSKWGGLNCDEGYNDKGDPYPQAAQDTMFGDLIPKGIKSRAAGMIKDLRPWLRDDIFEKDYGEKVYLHRSFTNPANSPRNNGSEIGKRTWVGPNRCSNRRSLLEEAQEVDAGGQSALHGFRHDSLDSYRKIPSRNILISHSMGGVASREYV
ncbi:MULTISPECIES: hypothetical protein [unclassified Fibrobacter]|nr:MULTISPECIES: hypothetical protein [unclassified Fibrobacter]OWV03220.1 hypothetical protein B7993_13840 [Fibrobacter sp. UWH3]SHL60427.1 hypothetical protein SAMN05720765_11845 [Fibrobacter sp. UWH6]